MIHVTKTVLATACTLGLMIVASQADDDLIVTKKPANKKDAAAAKVAPKANAQAAALPAAPDRPAAKPGQAIKLALTAGDDAAVVWNNYFAAHKAVPPADVRQTIRELMETKKFDQVAAVIQAALRNGQDQWWMYNALALALQAQDAPAGEIERVLMSAVDFANGNPDQLTYIAHCLARSGFDRRALQIYRQVTVLEPTRPEPYLLGLEVAKRLDDRQDAAGLVGIQWATLGILGQNWPKEQREIEISALRQAQATLDRFKTEKRDDLASQYRKKLDAALERDMVVKVTWTGNADVDISMEEPSGTICSFRNPRTTAGGVMLGDSFARLDKNAQDKKDGAEGYSEYYTCPKGFSGKYRLIVRRVWGQVTAGKVSVEVHTHYLSKDQQRIAKQCPLGDSDTVVDLHLKDGRRTEALAQREILNIARDQAALNHVLAQQLGAAGNPQALQNLLDSRGNAFGAFGAQRPFVVGLDPFVNRGAVGFRPVITTLPEGTNMAATAVISADRRYVRITAIPIFSQIGKVLTFNINTGDIGNGDPDIDDGGGGVP